MTGGSWLNTGVIPTLPHVTHSVAHVPNVDTYTARAFPVSPRALANVNILANLWAALYALSPASPDSNGYLMKRSRGCLSNFMFYTGHMSCGGWSWWSP